MRRFTKPALASIVLLCSLFISNTYAFPDGEEDKNDPYNRLYRYNSGYNNQKRNNSYNSNISNNQSGNSGWGSGTGNGDYEVMKSKKGKKGKNDDDDNYSSDDDDDDNNDVPLDGGLSFLVLAGAGLGIKKAADIRAKNKEQK